MDADNNSEKPEKKKIAFNLDFNLGHLFVIFSLFLSAAGLYAHDESRVSILETQMSALDDAHLNNRVSNLEATTAAIKQGIMDIHVDLAAIRLDLSQNHATTIIALKDAAKKAEENQTQTNQNTKAIKNRIFP